MEAAPGTGSYFLTTTILNVLFIFLIFFFLFLTKLFLKHITYIIQHMINMYQKFDTRGVISGFLEDAYMIPRIANVANFYPAVTVTNE